MPNWIVNSKNQCILQELPLILGSEPAAPQLRGVPSVDWSTLQQTDMNGVDSELQEARGTCSALIIGDSTTSILSRKRICDTNLQVRIKPGNQKPLREQAREYPQHNHWHGWECWWIYLWHKCSSNSCRNKQSLRWGVSRNNPWTIYRNSRNIR